MIMFFHAKESIFNLNTVVGCIIVHKYYDAPPPRPGNLDQWRALESGAAEGRGRRKGTWEEG